MLALFIWYISTNNLLVQPVVNLTFFSHYFVLILRSLTPKCTYTVFKNECSQFKNNVLEYFSLCRIIIFKKCWGIQVLFTQSICSTLQFKENKFSICSCIICCFIILATNIAVNIYLN